MGGTVLDGTSCTAGKVSPVPALGARHPHPADQSSTLDFGAAFHLRTRKPCASPEWLGQFWVSTVVLFLLHRPQSGPEVKTSHSDCRLGQLIPGGFSFPAYSPNKAHKELVVSCLLFHSCGAGVELPAFGAGQLWQGPLALPAAGRENFLSHLRALLGGLHLVSHQTLWFGVWGPPA